MFCVAMMAGGQPHLLKSCLQSIGGARRDIDAESLALVRGSYDRESVDILTRAGFDVSARGPGSTDRVNAKDVGVLGLCAPSPVASALNVSDLWLWALERCTREGRDKLGSRANVFDWAQELGEMYLLHLECTWALIGGDDAWLRTAKKVLRERHDVGQVRLRVMHDPLCQFNSVTGLDVKTSSDMNCLVGNWHATLGPVLMRVQDLPRFCPFATEAEFREKFEQAGFKVAQLIPGVFVRMGGEEVLT